MSNHGVSDALAGLTIGVPVRAFNLAIFPLLGEPASIPALRLLRAALREGSAEISEVSEAGTVPRVLLNNRGELPILALDGDHLVGCKQNRVLNTSVLAPARTAIELPVSCVEQGRWRSDGAHFELSPHAMFAELRAEKLAQVNRSTRVGARHQADQGVIWAGIAGKAERLVASSVSRAMDGIYKLREQEINRYTQAVRPTVAQRGAVFAINGRIVGLELLPGADSWALCHESIVSGYALDAVDHFTSLFPEARRTQAQEFVEHIGTFRCERFPAVALGEDLRFGSDEVAGSALELDDQLVHLCAFDLHQSACRDDPRRDARRSDRPDCVRRGRDGY